MYRRNKKKTGTNYFISIEKHYMSKHYYYYYFCYYYCDCQTSFVLCHCMKLDFHFFYCTKVQIINFYTINKQSHDCFYFQETREKWKKNTHNKKTKILQRPPKTNFTLVRFGMGKVVSYLTEIHIFCKWNAATITTKIRPFKAIHLIYRKFVQIFSPYPPGSMKAIPFLSIV